MQLTPFIHHKRTANGDNPSSPFKKFLRSCAILALSSCLSETIIIAKHMGDRRDKATIEAADDAPYWTDNLKWSVPSQLPAPTYEEVAGDRRL